MPDASPAELLRKWFEEVWNQGRTDLISVYGAPTARMYALDNGVDTVGPEEFLRFYEKLRGAIPDIHFTVHEVIESGQTAAGRWTATGTHQGDHLGPKATNNAVKVTGMSFLRAVDGQITEGWSEWDQLTLATVIGAVQPAGGMT
jgi:steroid delta-isomerase-like uncharacterized protein